MSKLYLILGMLLLCNNAFAGQPIKKDCYEQGYHDGSIYALVKAVKRLANLWIISSKPLMPNFIHLG